MIVYTKLVYDIASGRHLDEDFFEYNGSLCLGKGASPAETQIAGQQADFYNNLLQNYNQVFANNQAILGNLTNGWNTIFNAGPNQQGWSPAEAAAVNTQTEEGTAGEYNKALTALNAQIGTEGGGNTPGVTSGMDTQLKAAAAEASAAETAGLKNKNLVENYSQGRQNFLAAANALSGVASQYSPTGYGSLAGSAGQSAFSSADTVNKENQAASPWNVVSGILGGALGAGLDAFTGGLGGGLAKDIMGGFGGGGGGGSSNTPIGPGSFGAGGII